MSKRQSFSDRNGSTATITKTGNGYKLIVRDFYGNILKRSTSQTAREAKDDLTTVGESWFTTKGYVE